MRAITRLVRMLLPIVALAAACSSDGGGGSDATVGDNASTGDGTCAGVCSVLTSSNCFYAGGESDCNSSCNGWETQYVAAGSAPCQQAWSDYKACVSGGVPQCNAGVGEAIWNVLKCRGHWDHFQNYCMNGFQPSVPCQAVAVFDAVCAGAPGGPHAMSCFGDVPPGCEVGGTTSNANLYCCP